MISVILPAGSDLNALNRSVRALVPELGTVQVMVAAGGDDVAAYVADRPGLTHVPLGITEDARADAVRDAEGDTLLFMEPGIVLEKGWPEVLEKASKGSFALGTFQGKGGPARGIYAVKKSAYKEMNGLPKLAPLDELLSIASTQGLAVTALPLIAKSVVGAAGDDTPVRSQILLLESGDHGAVDDSVPSELARRLKRALANSVLRAGASVGPVQTVDASDRSIGSILDNAIATGADKVLLIDPLVPGVSEGLIRNALARLDEADLVVGPTHCGHCYLLGIDCGKVGALSGFETSLPISENDLEAHAQQANLSFVKTPELQACTNINEFRHFYCSGHIDL